MSFTFSSSSFIPPPVTPIPVSYIPPPIETMSRDSMGPRVPPPTPIVGIEKIEKKVSAFNFLFRFCFTKPKVSNP